MNIENLNKYRNSLLILNNYILLSHNDVDEILSESRLCEINMPLSHEQNRKIEEVTLGKPLRATLINLILYTCPCLSDEVRQLLYKSKNILLHFSYM